MACFPTATPACFRRIADPITEEEYATLDLNADEIEAAGLLRGKTVIASCSASDEQYAAGDAGADLLWRKPPPKDMQAQLEAQLGSLVLGH